MIKKETLLASVMTLRELPDEVEGWGFSRVQRVATKKEGPFKHVGGRRPMGKGHSIVHKTQKEEGEKADVGGTLRSAGRLSGQGKRRSMDVKKKTRLEKTWLLVFSDEGGDSVGGKREGE